MNESPDEFKDEEHKEDEVIKSFSLPLWGKIGAVILIVAAVIFELTLWLGG